MDQCTAEANIRVMCAACRGHMYIYIYINTQINTYDMYFKFIQLANGVCTYVHHFIPRIVIYVHKAIKMDSLIYSEFKY